MSVGYETLIIAHPEITEEELSELTEKLNEVITRAGGETIKVEKLGKRKLVYKIKKHTKGFFLVNYCQGSPMLPQTIDRFLRFYEKVLRYQTVRLNPKLDIEALRSQDRPGGSEPAARGEKIIYPNKEAEAQIVSEG